MLTVAETAGAIDTVRRALGCAGGGAQFAEALAVLDQLQREMVEMREQLFQRGRQTSAGDPVAEWETFGADPSEQGPVRRGALFLVQRSTTPVTVPFWESFLGQIAARVTHMGRDPTVIIDAQRDRMTVRMLVAGVPGFGEYVTVTLSPDIERTSTPEAMARQIVAQWKRAMSAT